VAKFRQKKKKEKHCSDPLPVRHVGGGTSPPLHSPGIPQSIFLFVAAHNTHTRTQTDATTMVAYFRTTAKKNNRSVEQKKKKRKVEELGFGKKTITKTEYNNRRKTNRSSRRKDRLRRGGGVCCYSIHKETQTRLANLVRKQI
jgi:hypothetical protein